MKRFSDKKEKLRQKKNQNLDQEVDKKEREGTMTIEERIKIERKRKETKKRRNRNETRDSTAIDLQPEFISKICNMNKKTAIFVIKLFLMLMLMFLSACSKIFTVCAIALILFSFAPI